MGGFGFIASIDKGLINYSLQKKMNLKQYSYLQKRAESIIKGVGLAREKDLIKTPCNFSSIVNGEETPLLLQYCKVPGNACELGIDGRKVESLKRDIDRKSFSNRLEYACHNVDTHTQAYALLSIWLNWARMLKANYSLDNR